MKWAFLVVQWEKSPLANSGDVGSVRELGRSPGKGNGNPLQYSSWRIPWTEEPGEAIVHGVAKSQL